MFLKLRKSLIRFSFQNSLLFCRLHFKYLRFFFFYKHSRAVHCGAHCSLRVPFQGGALTVFGLEGCGFKLICISICLHLKQINQSTPLDSKNTLFFSS